MDAIYLTPEETDTFIRIWKRHPCLWKVQDPGYRSRPARTRAMQELADTFARGWTISQVRRKLESLKTYWRSQTRKLSDTSQNSGNEGPTRVWSHYDQLNSFLTQENSSVDSCCEQPSGSSMQMKSFQAELQMSDEEEAREDGSSSVSTTLSDIAHLMSQVQSSVSSGSSATASLPLPVQKRPVERAFTSPQPEKKRALEHDIIATPDALENCAIGLLKEVHENHKQKMHDPIFNYVKTVADRLREIRNKRRLLYVKNSIDQIIHSALLEEMEDSI